MRTTLKAILLAVMIGVLSLLGADKNAKSKFDLASYNAIVESTLHSPKIAQADWDFMAAQNKRSLETQYAILPDKGKLYDRVNQAYTSLKGHSLVVDTMVFHIVHTRLGFKATEVAMRDEGDTVYFVDDFVGILDKRGLLEAAVAHECVHAFDDGKWLLILRWLKLSQTVKDQINWSHESEVDYRAAVALFEAGKNPGLMLNLLKFMKDESWTNSVQFGIRAEKAQRAINDLAKVKKPDVLVSSK